MSKGKKKKSFPNSSIECPQCFKSIHKYPCSNCQYDIKDGPAINFRTKVIKSKRK